MIFRLNISQKKIFFCRLKGRLFEEALPIPLDIFHFVAFLEVTPICKLNVAFFAVLSLHLPLELSSFLMASLF